MELEVFMKKKLYFYWLVTYPQGQKGQIFLPSTVRPQERNHELRHSSDLRGDALSLVQSSDKVRH